MTSMTLMTHYSVTTMILCLSPSSSSIIPPHTPGICFLNNSAILGSIDAIWLSDISDINDSNDSLLSDNDVFLLFLMLLTLFDSVISVTLMTLMTHYSVTTMILCYSLGAIAAILQWRIDAERIPPVCLLHQTASPQRQSTYDSHAQSSADWYIASL